MIKNIVLNSRFYKGYSNTKIFDLETEFNLSVSGIFVDSKLNTIKLKNTSNSGYLNWLQLDIGDTYDLDEFYIEYEIRNCSGEPLKLSVETQGDYWGTYRANAYSNTTSEWQKHITKIIRTTTDKGTQKTILSIGNTLNVAFNCEIRNISIKQNSKQVSWFKDSLMFNSGNFEPFLRAGTNESGTIWHIGNFSTNKGDWVQHMRLLLISEKSTALYGVWKYNSDYGVTVTHLGDKFLGENHLEFSYVENEENIDIYIKFKHGIRSLFLMNGFSNMESYIKKIPSLPESAQQFTVKEFKVPEYSPATILNTPYYTYKMEQDGVLIDFYSYLDKKYAYDKQLETEQKAKYEAYELLLQENPNLTYEEFEAQYSPIMSLEEKLKEPVIPQTVQDFMKKYL